jgi:DeoR family suf operon transcriptional repressor
VPTTTRQKILDYLKRNRTVSSREIARALRMTPANARHHLGILSADGRVEVINQRQVGRGRPEKVYRLAGTLVGDNLAALADAILTETGREIVMEKLGKRIAGKNMVADQPLAHKLTSTVERLNKMYYQARWEAGAEGPHIILGHCPYSAIIEKHPELCKMDMTLLSELLGGDVDQLAKLEDGAGGLPYCAFALTQS